MMLYLGALYLKRDLNYSAAFHVTMSRRRAALYATRGFSLERWHDLLDEGRDLRREINRLADDYNAHWSLTAEEGDHDAAAKAIEKRAQTTADKKPNDEKEDLDNDEVERKPK